MKDLYNENHETADEEMIETLGYGTTSRDHGLAEGML